MALLVPPLIGALHALPGFVLPDGRPDVQLLLLAVAAGVALAGLGQIVLAEIPKWTKLAKDANIKPD